MAEKRPKWIGLTVCTLILVLVLVGLSNRESVPEVQTVRVDREDLSSLITSNGKVEPVAPFILRAELATFVDQVKAVEGQPVHKGQLLLTLDSADARAQLAQARVDLISAEADLRNARAGGPPDELAQLEGDLRRAQADVTSLETTQKALQQLVAKQAATRDELDQNRLALERAQATLQTFEKKKEDLARRAALEVERAGLRAQHARELVRSLEEKVRSSTAIAPVDGTLYSLPVRAGDYVKVGDVLAEVADLHRVRVRAFVDEPDLGSLRPNQEVEITWDGLPGRVWTGVTETVPKQVTSRGTRSVGEALCSVSNDRLELLPNVNVDVRIRVREAHGALAVPRAAVRWDGKQHYVFVVRDDRLRRQNIQVGIASASRYQVLDGLKQGDAVALPGEMNLRDGMNVHPTQTRPAS